MPPKLSPTEPTTTLHMRLPLSMRKFLDRQKCGASKFVRQLIAKQMGRAK